MEQIILQLLAEKPYLSNKSIGEIVGLSRSSVQYYLNKLNIHKDRKVQQKLNNTSREKKLKITASAEQVILGSILGDGYMSPNRHPENTSLTLNSELRIIHSEQQLEYIKYKKELLECEGIKCYLTERKQSKEHFIKGVLVKENKSYYLKTCRNVSFNFYRNTFYKPHKVVGRYLYKLNSLGLAIWFMDDGYKHGNTWILCTNGFAFKEVEFLQKLLKHNFNLETSIFKSNLGQPLLYIKAKSKQVFLNLIKPYLCKSMLYKIGV